MDEFLKALRTFAEFPPAMETTPVAHAAWHRWHWRFRRRPASSRLRGTYLSRFYCVPWATPLSSHERHDDVCATYAVLRQRLVAVAEGIIDG